MPNFMKIVILEAATISKGDISFDPVYKLGEVIEYPLTPTSEIVRYVGDAEAALCNKTPFTSDILKECKKLKYIGVCATGYNNIDLKTASELGITVTNVPAYSTESVAQQVFSFILHFANKIFMYNDFVNDGGWVRSETFSAFAFPTVELAGKTIGIIGYGGIGQAVARIANAFGMNVIINTRTVKPDASANYVTLPELFKKSDFITVHCPLTDKTEGLINKDLLKLCKPSAVLINTSRGAIVNEDDLAYALNNGIIAGVGLDVLCTEPMSKNCPLLGVSNCVITPHVAWAPYETRERLVKTVADNLRAYQNGKAVNKVNI